MSANFVPAILYPGHDRESGGQVTDHSSVLDHHSVTDQQSQALDQRGSVIKTHRRHPPRLGSEPVANSRSQHDPWRNVKHIQTQIEKTHENINEEK